MSVTDPLDHPLYSPHNRLDKADQAYTRLKASVGQVFTEAIQGVTITIEPDAHLWLFHSLEFPTPPLEWHDDACEVFGKLREAMDHVAHAAAVAHLGRDLTEAEERVTNFPTCSTRQSFNSWKGGAVRVFSPEVLDRFEQLQVFNATDTSLWEGWAGPGFPNPLPVSLMIIHELSRRGKHRVLQRMAINVDMSRPPAEVHGVKVTGSMGRDSGGFAPGDLIGTWSFDGPPPLDPPPIELLKEHFPLALEFDQVRWMWPESEADFDFVVVPNALAYMNDCLINVAAITAILAPAILSDAAPQSIAWFIDKIRKADQLGYPAV